MLGLTVSVHVKNVRYLLHKLTQILQVATGCQMLQLFLEFESCSMLFGKIDLVNLARFGSLVTIVNQI